MAHFSQMRLCQSLWWVLKANTRSDEYGVNVENSLDITFSFWSKESIKENKESEGQQLV